MSELRIVCLSSLLIGCAAAPGTQREDELNTAPLTAVAPPPSVDFMPLRVGIEYLPPETDETLGTGGFTTGEHDPVSVHDLRPARSAARPVVETNTRERSAWLFDEEVIDSIEDPAQRYTIEFVNDALGEDRMAMRRDLRMPIFTNRLRHSQSFGLHTYVDEREADDEVRFINDVAPRLFRRPLRNLLKSIFQVEQIEIAVDEYAGRHVPLSDPYREENPDSMSWGRMSMRVRVNDLQDDPGEVTYYNWGWRVGSGLRRGRLGYNFTLDDRLSANVGVQYDYDTQRSTVRADLRYVFDERTHLNMLLGDNMQFLAGPTAYAFVNSPIDGSPGVLFYVEHLF